MHPSELAVLPSPSAASWGHGRVRHRRTPQASNPLSRQAREGYRSELASSTPPAGRWTGRCLRLASPGLVDQPLAGCVLRNWERHLHRPLSLGIAAPNDVDRRHKRPLERPGAGGVLVEFPGIGEAGGKPVLDRQPDPVFTTAPLAQAGAFQETRTAVDERFDACICGPRRGR